MSDEDMLNALIGAGLPFAIGAINRSSWPPLAKWVCYAIVCTVAALLLTYVQGGLELTAERFVHTLLVVGTAAAAFYKLYEPAVKQIERATG